MIKVVFEDNHILVVEKPRDILCQEDITGRPDMLTILKEDVKIRYNKPGNVYLGMVHRLDRPVGGIMVFARTSKAASRISALIRDRKFYKEYLAVIYGRPDDKEGSLESFLAKDRKKKKAVAVKNNEINKELTIPKIALLKYKVLTTKDNLSLVNVVLETGRFHQIRAQFAQLGNPLYGDEKYSGFREQKDERLALWSHKISFKHPVENEIKTFISFPPKEYPWNLFRFPESR